MDNNAIVVLALALLAHAAATRIPNTLGVMVSACMLYLFTLLFVLWALFHRVLS